MIYNWLLSAQRVNSDQQQLGWVTGSLGVTLTRGLTFPLEISLPWLPAPIAISTLGIFVPAISTRPMFTLAVRPRVQSHYQASSYLDPVTTHCFINSSDPNWFIPGLVGDRPVYFRGNCCDDAWFDPNPILNIVSDLIMFSSMFLCSIAEVISMPYFYTSFIDREMDSNTKLR